MRQLGLIIITGGAHTKEVQAGQKIEACIYTYFGAGQKKWWCTATEATPSLTTLNIINVKLLTTNVNRT